MYLHFLAGMVAGVVLTVGAFYVAAMMAVAVEDHTETVNSGEGT